jgi:hypothetical protein
VVPAGPRSQARKYLGSVRGDRSLSDAPRLSELVTRERGRVITWSRVRLNSRQCHPLPRLAPQSPHLGAQRVQLGTGDADHLRCFDAHPRLLRLALSRLSLVPRSPDRGHSNSGDPLQDATKRRACCVPDRTVNRGDSRSLTGSENTPPKTHRRPAQEQLSAPGPDAFQAGGQPSADLANPRVGTSADSLGDSSFPGSMSWISAVAISAVTA